jgi:hypothetical protein
MQAIDQSITLSLRFTGENVHQYVNKSDYLCPLVHHPNPFRQLSNSRIPTRQLYPMNLPIIDNFPFST